MSSKPRIAPYTELDDVRLLWGVEPEHLTMARIYNVSTYSVSVLGYICAIVIMTPAFLVNHAAMAAQLFGVLKEFKVGDPLFNPAVVDDSAEFEEKLYRYTLYLITVFVPGVMQNTNTSGTATPADFVNTFKEFVERVQRRRAYLATPKKEMAIPETYEVAMTYMQTEIHRIRELSLDPTALDKAVAGLENYIKFAFLHHHIIRRWTSTDVIEEMKELYMQIRKPLRRKKFPFQVRAGIDTLIASLELIQPTPTPTPVDDIPPPPPEPPMFRRMGRWRVGENAVVDEIDEEAIRQALEASVSNIPVIL